MNKLITKLADSLNQRDFQCADNICYYIVNSNWVIPLLYLIQQPISSESEEFAHQMFELLIQYVDARLGEENWRIDDDLSDIHGVKWYRNDISGVDTSEPKLRNRFWQFDMLQTLPILAVPGESVDGALLWVVEVAFHSVSVERFIQEIRDCSDINFCRPACEFSDVALYKTQESYSILNSLKFSDEIAGANGGLDEEDKRVTVQGRSKMGKAGQAKAKVKRKSADGEWVMMKQLVVGRWDGPIATPCLEVAGPAPALRGVGDTSGLGVTHVNADTDNLNGLETWHETTLAAIALSGIASQPVHRIESNPCQVLLLGASLAAVTSFLSVLMSTAAAKHHRHLLLTLVDGIDNADNGPELSAFVKSCLHNVRGGGSGRVDVEVVSANPAEFLSSWKRCNSHSNAGICNCNCCSNGLNAPARECLCRVKYDTILMGVGCFDFGIGGGSVASNDDMDGGETLSLASIHSLDMLQPWGTLAIATKEEENSATSRPLFSTATIGSRTVYRLYESNLTDDCSALAPATQQRYVVYVNMPCSKSSNSSSDGCDGLTVEWWLQCIKRLNQPSVEIEAEIEADSECTPDLVSLSASTTMVLLPVAMDVFAAQKTSAVRIPSLISPEEAASIHALAGKRVARANAVGTDGAHMLPQAARRIGREIRSKDTHLWEVLFLQTDGAFYSALPDLLEKATRAVCQVDLDHRWGLLSAGPFSVRVVEYHTQNSPSSAIGDTHHYDQDSLVTLDIMLSEPGVDFAGADIQTLEVGDDGDVTGLQSHLVSQYDALCFVSHKYHSVKPLLRGRRVVCVLEFWRGSPQHRHRTCPHRCLALGKPCALEEGPANGDSCNYGSRNSKEGSGDMDGVISPPFTLAAARFRPASTSTTIPCSLVNSAGSRFGGDVGLFWQATVASDGVDDKKPQVIMPLSDAAVQELDDMFGDD